MGVFIRSISAFILLLVLSPIAIAMTCGQLLSQPISYDSFVAERIPQEQVLRTYLRSFRTDLLSTETKVNTIVNILDYYHEVGRQIRRVEPDIFEIKFVSPKFSEINQKRYMESVEGMESMLTEILSERRINFKKDHNTILISTSGDHYLNRVARRLYEDGALEIGFNVHNLMRYTAGGIYFDGTTRRINLPLKVLRSKSFFQENISLHEFTHYKDYSEISKSSIFRPYHASINIKVLNHSAFDLSSIYRRGFSVDEIKAYRTTLRNFAHEALTAKSKAVFKENYQKLQAYLEVEIEFSRITKMVFERHLREVRNGKSAKDNVVIIPNMAEFTLSETAAKPANAQLTLNMANFTKKMFTLMALELNKHEEGTFEEQRAAVKRVNAILSKPEVRKLHGNYPSISSIAKDLKE